MRVRGYSSEDKQGIAAIHAEMGLDYKMIDLESPLVQLKTVIEMDGEIVAAAAGKMEPEIYLWLRPGCSPAVKWDAIRMIHRELVRQAVKMGFEQLVCYVPDCVGKFFGKRMKMLRWERQRDGWRAWVHELGAKP
jgi:hypothetical protein